MGEPSSVLMAAKLPADAMIVSAIGGASFFTRCTASAARPPPIAIKRRLRARVPRPGSAWLSAARMMPSSSGPTGGPPPVLNPKAGE